MIVRDLQSLLEGIPQQKIEEDVTKFIEKLFDAKLIKF